MVGLEVDVVSPQLGETRSCVFAMKNLQKQHVASLKLAAKGPQWLEDEFPFEKVYF